MRGKFYVIEEDWLREQYQIKGLSLRKIANIVGCNVQVIHDRMEKFGIPRRNSWSKKDTLYTNKDWLYEMFVNNKMTMGKMADLAQCSRHTISKWLREYNIIEENRYKRKSVYKHHIICEQCQKKLPAAPSRNRRFCSRQCSGLFHRERIKIQCLVCAKTTVIRKKEIKTGNGKFCSRECFYEWITGTNAPTWRGGTSFEPYSLDFTTTFKKGIRRRDLYKCAICEQRALSVHHIDYDKQNTTFENCITLCRSCHSKTNFNRKFWMTILLPIAKSRIKIMEN